jgi:hypothetical protein
MRDKINNDPMFQIGAVVVLIVVGFVLFTMMGKGGEEEESAAPTEATVSVAGTEASGTAVGATPGEAVEAATEAALEATVAPAPAVSAVTAPPLPDPVEAAYKGGETVVLLLVHDGGIDDRLVEKSTRALESFPDTAVFIVPAKQVARYGAITLGVEVEQVPALIVVRPKRLSKGVPQASVSYGFQTPEGIDQAMRDATYDGPEATYYPG